MTSLAASLDLVHHILEGDSNLQGQEMRTWLDEQGQLYPDCKAVFAEELQKPLSTWYAAAVSYTRAGKETQHLKQVRARLRSMGIIASTVTGDPEDDGDDGVDDAEQQQQQQQQQQQHDQV